MVEDDEVAQRARFIRLLYETADQTVRWRYDPSSGFRATSVLVEQSVEFDPLTLIYFKKNSRRENLISDRQRAARELNFNPDFAVIISEASDAPKPGERPDVTAMREKMLIVLHLK